MMLHLFFFTLPFCHVYVWIDSSISGSSTGDRDEDDDDDDYGDDAAGGVGNESLLDRVRALRDMVPPRQRKALAGSLTAGQRWLRAGPWLGGKTLWVVSTSVMLVGMAWALAYADEAQAIEQEKEMRMQQAANEVGLIPFFFFFSFFSFFPRGGKPFWH